MTDEVPKGYVPVVGEIVGDGEVRPAKVQDSNRIPTGAEMERLWGRHPMADWKPKTTRKRSSRRWMKR